MGRQGEFKLPSLLCFYHSTRDAGIRGSPAVRSTYPFGQRPIKGASDEALIDQAILEVPSLFSRERNELVMHSSCLPPLELAVVVVEFGRRLSMSVSSVSQMQQ
jgi:hypothetical protein